LSDNEVLAILEDQTGVLWIGTRGGLDTFDSETGTGISLMILAVLVLTQSSSYMKIGKGFSG